jgi:histidinol-phosphate aminotransferase
VLRHIDLLHEQAQAIKGERARVAAALGALPGVTVFPSAANFLLLRVPDSGRAFQALRAHNILVKNADGWHALLARCLRITVGLPQENDAVIATLSQLLQ